MERDVTTLGDHLAIMRRRWRIPLLCALLGVVAGVGLSSMQDQVYAAQSVVLLEPQQASTTATVMDPDEVATQARIIASEAVAERVIDSLGLSEKPHELLRTISVEMLEQTRTVGITAERSTAAGAAAVANAFAQGYIDSRTASAVRAANEVRGGLIEQLGTLTGQLSAVDEELGREGLADGRQQQLEARRQSLEARMAELRIEVSLARDDVPSGAIGGEVLTRATRPGTAVQPRPLRAAAFGGLIGLVLGVLLAYARDRFDDAIRDEQRLRSAVDGQPVLGRIPQQEGDASRLVTLVAPHSAESEAYRSLTTNVRFLTSGHHERSEGEMLVVTSAVAGEGKTTIAANVAVSAARVGLRVMLVDADLRDPDVANRFGLETPFGLSHVLADQEELEKVVFDAAELDVPGLSIIGAGTVPPNPAELLASVRARSLWRELRLMADLVIVDTAPVTSVADTLEIVGAADVTVLSARQLHSRAHQIEATVERIRQVGGSVAGVAWCAVPRKDAAYGYGYGNASTD